MSQPSQCSECAAAGFTEAQCFVGQCVDVGEEGEISGCGDCAALLDTEQPVPPAPATLPQAEQKEERQMKIRAGGVLYRQNEGQIQIGVVRAKRQRKWGLPKGKVDEGEQPRQAAIREVKEETGLTFVPGPKLGTVERTERVTHWWPMEVTGGEFVKNDEIAELKFVELGEAIDRISSGSQREMVQALAARLQTAQ